MTTQPHLLVLCVNYDSADAALRFARQVAAQRVALTWELIIVDNTDHDRDAGSLSDAVAIHQNVRVQRPGRNLGYFGAADWALRRYLESQSLPDWVMVANADLSMTEPAALAPLEQPDLCQFGILAPAIISSLNRRDQNPYLMHRPSVRRLRFLLCVASWYPLMLAYFGLHLAKKYFRQHTASQTAPVSGQPIYAAHGACMIFSRRFFERGGTLNYGSFLFGEELFAAETARALNLEVRYMPELRVQHEEHRSTGWLRSRQMVRYQRQSLRYCIERFFAP